MLNNLGNWLLFCFFVVGALGGITYLVRLMFWKEVRTEVRYMQVPFYYGPREFRDPVPFPGRPGDMGEHDEPSAQGQPVT